MVASGPLHLLQELLRQRAAVGQLRQLVGEGVLLLRLEELRVADGDRRLRRDPDQEVALVFGQLTPCIEVQLQGAHQLARALHGHDEHVLRVASRLEPRCCVLRQSDHDRAHGRQRRPQGLLAEGADAASRAMGQAVLGLAAHLRLAGHHQVHRTRNRAHDASRMPDGHVEDLLETQRRVDRRRHRQQQRGPVSGAALVLQGLLQASRHAAHPHEGDRQQNHRDDEQHRGDQKDGRYIQKKKPSSGRSRHRVTPGAARLIPAILASDLEPISFDDLPLGGEWTTRRRTISEAEIALFGALAGDFSPLTVDVSHAGARFAPPALLVAVAIGLGTMDMPVPSVAEWEWVNWKFPRPVKAGETIYARWTLTQKRAPVGGAPTAIVVWRVDVHTVDGALCAEGEVGASVLRNTAASKTRGEEPAAAAGAAGPASRRRRRRRAPAGDGAKSAADTKAALVAEAPVVATPATPATQERAAGGTRRRRRRRSPAAS